MAEHLPRWRKVGVPEAWLDIEGMRHSIATNEKIAARPKDAAFGRAGVVHGRSMLAMQLWLLGRDGEAREEAAHTVEAAEDYFFGPWQDEVPSGNYHDRPPDRSYWRTCLNWGAEYPEAVLWAACLGRWEAVARLSEFVTGELYESTPVKPPMSWPWLIVLASVLRGEGIEGASHYAQIIRDGSRKREKLLLGLLDAILTGDDQELAEASWTYFAYYKKSESRSEDNMSKVAIDGSTLFHYGKRVGHNVPVPEHVRMHIVEFAE